MENNSNSDAIAARRRAIAEALRTGGSVVVSPSGQVSTEEEVASNNNGQPNISVPQGKLA